MTFHTKLQQVQNHCVLGTIKDLSKAMMKLDIQYCFDCGWFDRICDRIKYKMKNKDITDSVNHTFVRIRIDSYNSLPTEKISSFYVIILIVKTLY